MYSPCTEYIYIYKSPRTRQPAWGRLGLYELELAGLTGWPIKTRKKLGSRCSGPNRPDRPTLTVLLSMPNLANPKSLQPKR